MGDGIQTDDIEAAQTADASHPNFINVNELLPINVTTSLLAWHQNLSSNHGWFLKAMGNDGVSVYSAEGLEPPKLVVEIAGPIPAVTTWGMAALVLLVMAAGTVVFRRLKVAV